jgi:CubicO group peptidase (beta-lactamase class C family)
MSAERVQNLARSMIVDAGVAPAAVLAAAARSTTAGWRFVIGAAGVRSEGRPDPVDTRTPFDLASVTKPIAATAIARLVQAGLFDWKTPLGALLPELAQTASGTVPIELLLSHRAGLDAHQPLYLPLIAGERTDVRALLQIAADSRRDDCDGTPPDEGFPPLYSDLGYLLAGAAAARAAGRPFARVIAEQVAMPLGIEVAPAEDWTARDAGFHDRVAPTEVVARRGGEIIGQVHDENAWAFSGLSTAGHAGLFGTAESVARFGASFLDALAGRAEGWLESARAEVLTRPRPLGTLRAGFDGRSEEGSAAGTAHGPRSFGHLGFTGTSVWCDPDRDVVTVILTNRVSPTRDNIAIRRVRPALNDALVALAEELREG